LLLFTADVTSTAVPNKELETVTETDDTVQEDGL